jgi:hypothetical protein
MLACGTVTSFGPLKVRLEHGSLNSGALASTTEARRHKYPSSGVGARRGWNRPLARQPTIGVVATFADYSETSGAGRTPAGWRFNSVY